VDIVSGAINRLTYCNVWTPTESGGVTYRSMTDPTGTDGNISADPKYRDAGHGVMMPWYGSPCIDAADSLAASASDMFGAPRYDDPRTPNRGVMGPDGDVADMGAVEFIEAGISGMDLMAENIKGPAAATAGEEAVISWSVRNFGTVAVSGIWHDRIVLAPESAGPWDAEIVVTNVVSTATLAPGQAASFQCRVRVPGGTEGLWRWKVMANSRGDIVEGDAWVNNTAMADSPMRLHVPELAPNAVKEGGLHASDTTLWFTLPQPADNDAIIRLESDAAVGETHMYVGYGRMPTPYAFDLRQGSLASPGLTMGVPAPAKDRLLYILVKTSGWPAESLGYRLRNEVGFASEATLTSLGLTQAGNAGRVTIPFYGIGFDAHTQAVLRHRDSSLALQAVATHFVHSQTLYATFDLTGVSTGVYHAVVYHLASESVLTDAFAVMPGTGGRLDVRLAVSPRVGVRRTFPGYVHVQNVGDADVSIPLVMVVSPQENTLWLPGETEDRARTELQLIPSSRLCPGMGVLSPGEKWEQLFYCQLAGGVGAFQVYLIEQDDTESFSWAQLEEACRPDAPHALWNTAWDLLSQRGGSQCGSYVQVLEEAAQEASQQSGTPVHDVGQLLGYMVRRELALSNNVKVSGMLRDDKTGEPIPSHGLFFEGSTTNYYTESWLTGAFSLLQAEPGTYTVYIDGYYPNPWGTVAVPSVGSVTGLDVRVSLGAIVEGKVLNAAGAAPITNAWVSIYNAAGEELTHRKTDAKGEFAITGLPDGDGFVQVFAHGFCPSARQTVSLSSETSQYLMVALSRGAGVQGAVRTPAGLRIGGARIRAWAQGEYRTAWAESARNGQYTLSGLPAGRYTLSADAPGYGAVVVSNVMASTASVYPTCDLTLMESGSITGRVTAVATGDPIAEARLSMAAFDDLSFAETNASGEYGVDDVAEGVYVMRVTAEGYQDAQVLVTNKASLVTRRDVSLHPPGQVAGYVRDVYGAPISGVYVSLYQDTGGWGYCQTGSDGAYEFTDIPDSRFLVGLYDAGATPAGFEGEIEASNFSVSRNISLPGGRISGCITDANAAAATNAMTYLLREDGAWIRARTDNAGRYGFMVLDPGPVRVILADPAYGYAVSPPMTPADGDMLVASAFAAGTGGLEVRCTAPTAGNPVLSEASVSLEVRVADGVYGPPVFGESDGAGTFLFSGLEPGPYRLTAGADGHVRQTTNVVVTVESAALSLPLTAGRVIQGTLMASDGQPAQGWVHLVNETTLEAATVRCTMNGAFSATTLPTGTYRLTAGGPGGDTPIRRIGIDLVSASARTLALALEASGGGSVTGRVVNAAGAPVYGALVGMADGDGVLLSPTHSGFDGVFALGPLPTGTVSIAVQASAYTPVSETVDIVEGETAARTIALGAPFAVAMDPFAPLESPAPMEAAPALAASLSQPAPLSGIGNVFRGFMRNHVDDFATSGVPPPERLYSPFNALPPFDENKCTAWRDYYDKCLEMGNKVDEEFFAWQDRYRAFTQIGSSSFALIAAKSSAVALKGAMLFSSMQKNLSGAETELNGLFGGDPGKAELFLNLYSGFMTQVSAVVANVRGDPMNIASHSFDSVADILNTTGKNLIEFTSTQLKSVSFGDVLGVVSLVRDFMGTIKEAQDSIAAFKPEMEAYLECQELYHRHALEHKRMIAQLNAISGYCRSGGGGGTDPKPNPVPFNNTHRGQPYVVETVVATDPNDKVVVGGGRHGQVRLGDRLHYTIRFENVSTATAPASVVMVEDELSPDLNWGSLELETIGFNGATVIPPAGLTSFETSGIVVASDPHPVTVTAHLNMATGVVRWDIRSIDPATGDIPEDPLAGFLPPNTDDGVGEGYVSFSILPADDLPEGALLTNGASIVFDANDPIVTPVVTNRMDRTPPESAVAALPETCPAAIPVQWSGQDGAGSGVETYDVFVSSEGGPYALWKSGVSETSGVYPGEVGRGYAFYSIATDGAGNREPARFGATTLKPEPDAETEIPTLIEIKADPLPRLRWPSVVGREYTVEMKARLEDDEWAPVTNLTANSSMESMAVTNEAPSLFFRVRKQCP
jgi:hypothetical protein